MHAYANDASPIPSAPFDDLDRAEDEEEWERRVMALAAARLVAVARGGRLVPHGATPAWLEAALSASDD
jgi:hypothetical protein